MRRNKRHSVDNHFFIFKMIINGSSSIAAVTFGDNNAVGVKFTSNDTEYGFVAQNQDAFRGQLEMTIAKEESVGKFIATARKNGTLTAV